MSSGPVRVAIVNDYDIVVAGTAAVLEPFADRVQVVELDSRMPVVSDVDVVLYDSFGQVQGDSIDVKDLVRHGDGKVLVFSWNTDEELVTRAMKAGAAGYLHKGVSAEELVAAIEAVHRGEQVLPVGQDADTFGRWPGDEHGLSARESEVLALICQGLSNQDIAERAFLGINTVKTYIRTAYRKIGAGSRTQAVLWGMQHGFEPDRRRVVVDD
ncbi:response regulator transcription factor [Nocardioides rubriscoriae]|uniref:response regulator transcription factor n=1 Tax=Nocardioides rubriscoriae TaxID=642762 RepID=UPI0011E02B9B|nr:response regulator transcription factor [Nocardioides rubriscoriae]